MAGRAGETAKPHTSLFDHLDSQICGGSSDPLSIPSQPPDIRNWFSSYQYESPDSSTLFDLDACLLPGKDDVEIQHPLESPSAAKDFYSVQPNLPLEQLLCEFPPKSESFLLRKQQTVFQEFAEKSCAEADNYDGDDICGGCKNTHRKHEQSPNWFTAKVKGKLPRLDDVANKIPSDGDLKLGCNVGKDGYDFTRNWEDYRSNRGEILSEVTSKKKCEDTTSEVGNKREASQWICKENDYIIGNEGLWGTSEQEQFQLEKKQRLEQELDDQKYAIPEHPRKRYSEDSLHEKDTTGVYHILETPDEISQQEQTSQDEHVEEQRTSGGYISTKNKENLNRNGDDLSMFNHKMSSKNRLMQKEVHINSIKKDKTLLENEHARTGKRTAFTDRTNIQEAADAAPEIPGKWHCPRKSKPYVGPPMKQLRLEHWVHRIN